MIQIINGPNLNLQGRRQPAIYGAETFEQLLERLSTVYPDERFEYRQTNGEGCFIDILQEADAYGNCKGIIINPGAYSHYSYAIADAIAACTKPVIEVHISNIHAREEFRRHSVTGAMCAGVIAGFGLNGYELAVKALLQR